MAQRASTMPPTLEEVYRECCRLLPRHVHDDIGLAFAAINDNRGRVEYALEILRKYGLLSAYPREAVTAAAKSALKSTECRKLAKDQLDDSLAHLNDAVGAAPRKSEELGNALLDRSEKLCELSRIELAITDLENALNCQNMNVSSVHAQIDDLKRKLELQENEATDRTCDNPIPPALSFKPSAKFACAGDCIEMRRTTEKGRHIVATTAIKAGDVIAVEAPYVAIVLPEPSTFGRCHLCMRLNYASLPCDTCRIAFYCSEACRSISWNSHHKYECPIAGILLNMRVDKLNLMALRISFVAAPEYREVQAYREDDEERYESDRYKEIHHLCANTERRTVADLFKRAVCAAMLFSIVEEHTTFFADGNDAGVFQELLLRHMQTAPTNFHDITEKFIYDETSTRMDMYHQFGAGAYSFHSLLNHSCAPNVVRYCYGAKLALFALSDIDKGEELYDNYGFHYAVLSKESRQESLKSQYLLDCNCTACSCNWPEYCLLPMVADMPYITDEDVDIIYRGDSKDVNKLLNNLLQRVHALKDHPSSKNIAAIHELIKECLSQLSNRKYWYNK